MKLSEDRVELLQVILTGTDDTEESVEFSVGDFEKEMYAVNPSSFWKHWPEDNAKEISKDSFLKILADKELRARVFLGWEHDKQNYRYYDDWTKLADAMGISEMVTLTTKVPKNVARRFTIFANETGSVSERIRKLVYDYTRQYMADNSKKLIFRESV